MSFIDDFLSGYSPASGNAPSLASVVPKIDPSLMEPTKPKSSFWGLLADSLSIGAGGTPTYAPRKEREALEFILKKGLSPEETYSEMSGVNTKAAQDYLKNYQESQKDAVAQQTALQALAFKARDRIASGLRATRGKKEDFDRFLPIAQAMADKYGIPRSEIPTEYNPELIDRFVLESVPVDKQIDNEETVRSHTTNEDLARRKAEAEVLLSGGRLRVAGANARTAGANAVTAAANARTGSARAMTGVSEAGSKQNQRTWNQQNPSKNRVTSKGDSSAPPRPGRFVGEPVVNQRTGKTYRWDGKDWK